MTMKFSWYYSSISLLLLVSEKTMNQNCMEGRGKYLQYDSWEFAMLLERGHRLNFSTPFSTHILYILRESFVKKYYSNHLCWNSTILFRDTHSYFLSIFSILKSIRIAYAVVASKLAPLFYISHPPQTTFFKLNLFHTSDSLLMNI